MWTEAYHAALRGFPASLALLAWPSITELTHSSIEDQIGSALSDHGYAGIYLPEIIPGMADASTTRKPAMRLP